MEISESSKPIRHLTFRCANLFADAEPALQTARIKQTTTVSSASSAGTWALFCEGTDYGPAATTASQECLTRRLPQAGVRVVFAAQSLAEENSLPKVSSRAARFTWWRHYVRLLFPPGISRGPEVVGHVV